MRRQTPRRKNKTVLCLFLMANIYILGNAACSLESTQAGRSRMDTLQFTLNDIGHRLKIVERRTNDLRDENTEVTEVGQAIEQGLRREEAENEIMRRRLDSLDRKLMELEEKFKTRAKGEDEGVIRSVEARVDALEAKLIGLEQKIEAQLPIRPDFEEDLSPRDSQ